MTREAKGPVQWVGMPGSGSLRQLTPPSSLRYMAIGEAPAKMRLGSRESTRKDQTSVLVSGKSVRRKLAPASVLRQMPSLVPARTVAGSPGWMKTVNA